MIIGYARVSTDAQALDAQIEALRAAGAEQVFHEKISGARRDRPELRRLQDGLSGGDVLLVTRLDRLARSTRELLDVLADIAERGATFRSLGDGLGRHDHGARAADADRAGRAGRVRTGADLYAHSGRTRAGENQRGPYGAQTQAHPPPAR